MRTVYDSVLPVIALQSTTAHTNGTVNGTAVDTALFNNNFRDLMFVITTGTITDGTHVANVEESDVSGSGYAAVDSSRVFGSVSLSSTDSNKAFSIGVRPSKRFVRVNVVTTGATTGGVFLAAAVLGNGSFGPTARS